MPDVVVIGAGIVGAACAYYAARAGLDVAVVDRGPVAGGTTGAGEGNILVSDKEPGPELGLALLSNRLWRELAASGDGEGARRAPGGARPGGLRGPARAGGGFEFEAKGGLVVAETAQAMEALAGLAARQGAGSASGGAVESTVVAPDRLRDYEPHLAGGLAGGVFYPQDAQVQPALAAARLIRGGAERFGRSALTLRTGVTVTGFTRDGGRVTGVRTDRGDIPAGAVVNAAGTWGGEVAALAGTHVPVLPRRGFILVTEPLEKPLIRHKVYTAAYVTAVASDSAGLETSAVVEGTPAGPVLIGASRERAGFDRTVPPAVLGRLAAQAVALFPALARRRVIRAYCGFRPYCPDHLPVIGEDPRAPGLYHACGHEGAGIGLAPATGHLLAQALTGLRTDLDLTPFRPDRFEGERR
ncbi:NAD(P)/FAD-dependent oxidoreductase [Planomonospora venezuelensis]|uniref:Glycine/D-amino acid oxidase-like deaminating enzyme n=1 Tax=Planomonospora venezuelensis TaxID=1999 RepID=A0A841D4K9_PLAVE|nr:glycine/D-amino acid oxidase-like deaminating enzyme [Planomonospora venezuelensis]GIN05518.1 oxidoreductase [Planomonospora venezuelensis]